MDKEFEVSTQCERQIRERKAGKKLQERVKREVNECCGLMITEGNKAILYFQSKWREAINLHETDNTVTLDCR